MAPEGAALDSGAAAPPPPPRIGRYPRWISSGKTVSIGDAPPSTAMTWPAIQPASSAHRSVTALPMSAGVVNRPAGVRPPSCQARLISCTGVGRLFKALSSVSPGLRAFTRHLDERRSDECRNAVHLHAATGRGWRVHPERREARRSEEHTSELQSLAYLVCRLLLEKKKK